MINVIKSGRGGPPECILLEFDLRNIFGKRFFTPLETEINVLSDGLYVSRLKLSTQDLAFELRRTYGVKQFIICGFATKYHLENELRAIKALRLESLLVMDCLSIMDTPSVNTYLLELKNTYGAELCLSGDFTSIVLTKESLMPYLSLTIQF